MTPKEYLRQRLIALCEREGGHIPVSRAAGVSDQTIYQIVTGQRLPSGETRGVGPKLQRRISEAYPGWAHLPSVGTQGNAESGGVALSLSLHQDEDVPLLTWEQMQMGNVAYKTFRAFLRDQAMAPALPAGTECRFERDLKPDFGDAVIVRDSSGTLHFRKYAQRIGGGFLAEPENAAYATLDSVAHGLMVLGVYVGHVAHGRYGR